MNYNQLNLEYTANGHIDRTYQISSQPPILLYVYAIYIVSYSAFSIQNCIKIICNVNIITIPLFTWRVHVSGNIDFVKSEIR